MKLTMLKSKLHRATVTEANLNYVGSITIDSHLLKEADLLPYEKVQIVDINNGERFETYIIPGESNNGDICLNGAAARCVQKGDKVIIMAYCNISEDKAKKHNPVVLFLDDNNKILEKTNYESHGEIK